jgi:hypothetical protein
VNSIARLTPPKAFICALAVWFLPLSTLWPTTSLTPVPPVSDPCPRFQAGSVVRNPPALFSRNGYLSVRQLLFDCAPQPLRVVGIDGVPVDSQDGTAARTGGSAKALDATHILIPTAARAEFIVTAPDAKVQVAELVTRKVQTSLPYP